MGINVASDTKAGLRFADMIVDGHKTLESRNSDTLRPYVGKRVAIVRTGEGKAKAIGEVTIGEPKVVNQRQFRAMEDEHRVPKGSRFDINTPTKHLYPMHDPVRYEEERDVGHGIVSRQVIHKARGGQVEPTISQMLQELAKGGKVEVRPTVKDEALMRKIPQMEEAAKKVSEGKMSHEAYDKVVAKHKPVKPYEFVPKPASDEDADRALRENRKPYWRGHEKWPAGRKVGLRLDIPSYEDHGVWINSIHDEEGKGDDKLDTSYGPVSSVKNATFDAGPSKALRVATGEQNKSSFARIKGDLHHMTEDEAVAHMQKNLNHKDYAQVGMDPRRHGYFYDRKTMKPVTHSKHVVQIGPLVLAHKPTYGERDSYAKGGVIHKAEGGKVEPTVDQMRQALINRHGLYSPLEKAALEMPRNKGTGAEFMAELSKRPGYKAEEIADRKIPTPEGKMTKAEFLEHLKKHSLPPLQETIKGALTPKDEDKVWDDVAMRMYGVRADDLSPRHFRVVEDEVPRVMRNGTDTRYEKYQLPDGENYREVLLTLPQSRPNANKYSDPAKYDADMRAFNAKGQEDFQSSHWRGHPNVLAHLRMSDRTGPNGEKLLHLEEVQSDWHQEGRERGYKKSNEEMMIEQSRLIDEHEAKVNMESKRLSDEYKAIKEKMRSITDPNSPESALLQGQEIETLRKLTALSEVEPPVLPKSRGTPNAPFKKSWHEMALKHALHHAAKNGYDGMVITPGEEQANRYDLSKQVGQISYTPSTKNLMAFDHNGSAVVNESNVSPEDLEKYLGAGVTQKLKQAEFEGPSQVLRGSDISVGGEGMKGFYDKMIPSYLNKLGKPHGAQVGQMPISFRGERRSPTESVQAIEDSGISMQDYHLMPLDQRREKFDYKTKTVPLHYLPINDQMRTSILKEGLPQYMRGGIVHKAEGGAVLPIEQIKAQMMNRFKGLNQLQSIGANEAPSMGIKAYVPTAGSPDAGQMPVGGIDTSQGDLPVGGVDMDKMQQGHQLMPNAPPAPAGQQQGMNQTPMGDMPPPMGGTPPPQGGSNILSMTPQGQAMAAMKPQGLKDGGSAKSTADMKAEIAAKKSIADGTSTRIKIDAEGPGGVKGIVVPRHMWEGKTYKGEGGKKVEGMRDVNEARAKVYGSERRDPLSSGQMNSLHKKILAEHFQKPLEEQTKAEEEALEKLREAKHIGKTANTLDKSEKLDTVNHEEDSQGRNYVGFASKGVAGHSLYTSGHGENQKHHVINTCAGQTVGCGGGTDKNGIVDTSRGTCFAPNAESQYVNAAVRRASHEQAKHDPAMSKDWILAHTGSLRNAAENADKKNKVLLFRPNVVDETDVTSRHAIRHLNDQRKATGKPSIEANSYGKTNELHDPENGYHVTHSNVGPKVKKGQEISENIARDKARVRNTVLASDNKGDFKNEQGNKTPPKGSYMVTDVKRGSEMSKNMEKHITHAKYWTTGRPKSELTPEEISQGEEGHYGGDHKPTTEDDAHYGHKTVKGLRFDYQKQHVLHPRLVQVGFNEDGSKHMIPTDSRFKDTEFLPKDRFKSKNGKDAGHILMTTPTESTSSIGHQTSFTHHVNEGHIEHAKKNKGEYEIDKPEDQLKASGKEYAAPQAIKFYADGGTVGGRHIGFSDDDFHAFPEQNVVAQRHLAMRGHDKEPIAKHGLSDHKRKVTINKDMDTMLLELTRNKKAK
jgi:hypothetical protein